MGIPCEGTVHFIVKYLFTNMVYLHPTRPPGPTSCRESDGTEYIYDCCSPSGHHLRRYDRLERRLEGGPGCRVRWREYRCVPCHPAQGGWLVPRGTCRAL